MSLHTLSVAELAAGLRSKQFSATELARHFIARSEAHNGLLNGCQGRVDISNGGAERDTNRWQCNPLLNCLGCCCTDRRPHAFAVNPPGSVHFAIEDPRSQHQGRPARLLAVLGADLDGSLSFMGTKRAAVVDMTAASPTNREGLLADDAV